MNLINGDHIQESNAFHCSKARLSPSLYEWANLLNSTSNVGTKKRQVLRITNKALLHMDQIQSPQNQHWAWSWCHWEPELVYNFTSRPCKEYLQHISAKKGTYGNLFYELKYPSSNLMAPKFDIKTQNSKLRLSI